MMSMLLFSAFPFVGRQPMIVHDRVIVIAILFGVALGTTRLSAQTANEGIGKQLLDSCQWFEAQRTVPTEGARPLQIKTVIKFLNAERVGENAPAVGGFLLLCVDEGRPVSAIHVYPWDGNICHTLDLLARQPNLSLKYRSGVDWQPNRTDVRFRRIEGVVPPDSSAVRRLRQLKRLSNSFTAMLEGFVENNADRQQLRLLPTPLYRYTMESSDESGTFDGAVFAFVQGNDPEVLLMIEAIREQGLAHWEYAFVRASAGALSASLNGAVVWEAEKFPIDHDPTGPHFTMNRRFGEP